MTFKVGEQKMSVVDKLGGKLYSTALAIYADVFAVLPSNEWIHWGQCASAMGSVVSNIAEANGRKCNEYKYYRNFMLHSRGSAFEVVAWLQMGVVTGVVAADKVDDLIDRLLQLSDSLFDVVSAA